MLLLLTVMTVGEKPFNKAAAEATNPPVLHIQRSLGSMCVLSHFHRSLSDMCASLPPRSRGSLPLFSIKQQHHQEAPGRKCNAAFLSACSPSAADRNLAVKFHMMQQSALPFPAAVAPAAAAAVFCRTATAATAAELHANSKILPYSSSNSQQPQQQQQHSRPIIRLNPEFFDPPRLPALAAAASPDTIQQQQKQQTKSQHFFPRLVSAASSQLIRKGSCEGKAYARSAANAFAAAAQKETALHALTAAAGAAAAKSCNWRRDRARKPQVAAAGEEEPSRPVTHRRTPASRPSPAAGATAGSLSPEGKESGKQRRSKYFERLYQQQMSRLQTAAAAEDAVLFKLLKDEEEELLKQRKHQEERERRRLEEERQRQERHAREEAAAAAARAERERLAAAEAEHRRRVELMKKKEQEEEQRRRIEQQQKEQERRLLQQQQEEQRRRQQQQAEQQRRQQQQLLEEQQLRRQQEEQQQRQKQAEEEERRRCQREQEEQQRRLQEQEEQRRVQQQQQPSSAAQQSQNQQQLQGGKPSSSAPAAAAATAASNWIPAADASAPETTYMREVEILLEEEKRMRPMQLTQLPGRSEAEVKALRVSIKKQINTALNQLASTTSQVIRTCEGIRQFMRGLQGHPAAVSSYFTVQMCERLLQLTEKGGQVSTRPSAAWAYAFLVRGMTQEDARVERAFRAHVYATCCYAAPFYYRKKQRMSLEQFRTARGQREGEDEEAFFIRMVACLRLWLCFLVASHREGEAWSWLARFLNLNLTTPKAVRRVCPCALVEGLRIAGPALLKAYGRQFRKIMDLIQNALMPLLTAMQQKNEGTCVSMYITQLRTLLSDYYANNFTLPEPEGKEMKMEATEASPDV